MLFSCFTVDLHFTLKNSHSIYSPIIVIITVRSLALTWSKSAKSTRRLRLSLPPDSAGMEESRNCWILALRDFFRNPSVWMNLQYCFPI